MRCSRENREAPLLHAPGPEEVREEMGQKEILQAESPTKSLYNRIICFRVNQKEAATKPNAAASDSDPKQDTATDKRGGKDPWEQETHPLGISTSRRSGRHPGRQGGPQSEARLHPLLVKFSSPSWTPPTRLGSEAWMRCGQRSTDSSCH